MPYDYGDTEIILKLITDTYQRYKHKRGSHERVWWRNMLYLIGNQWIRWDDLEGRWRRRRLRDWVPTPVTNRFASTGERLVSVLSRIEPNWTFVPASDREEDVVAASIADQIEEIICEENDIETVREDLSRWLVYTGNAYLFSWAEEVINIRLAGELIPEEQIYQAALPPTYKLYTEVYSPFEVYADMSIARLSNQERILLLSRKDADWVKKTYGISADESELENLGIKYLESIGYTTEDVGAADVHSQRDQRIPRVTIRRILVQPSDDWPEGLYAVSCGDKIVEAKAFPKTPEGKPFLPLIQMKFDAISGAFFAKSPMNDVARKQEQRNKLESLIELITLRMASPVWLMPEGTVVHGFTGEPGAVIKYSLIGDKAHKPDRIPGEQIPSTLIAWLQQLDKDIEEVAATAEVMKGQAPYSGAPGVVVDQLLEQSLTRFGPTLRNIAEGYRRWMKMQIELFRTYATTPRITASLGTNQKWKISKFSRADISGAVNVRIESDSTIPRSNQVEAARILAAVNVGLVDIADPLIRLKVLKKLQLTELMEDINDESISAIREQEKMLAGEKISARPFVDNHDIHIRKHKSFAQTEEAAHIMDILMQHITEHNMLMDAEMTPTSPPISPPAGRISEGDKEILAPKESIPKLALVK